MSGGLFTFEQLGEADLPAVIELQNAAFAFILARLAPGAPPGRPDG